jgi:hypothetical protein
LTSCAPWGPKLSFPKHPLRKSSAETWYDTNNNHKPDFALHRDPAGAIDSLLYDDNQDGSPDRTYNLSEYSPEKIPHVIILLDSLPYQLALDRYNAGNFRYFTRPAKVIGVFPTLTELCYTRVLGTPPLAGMTEQFYDPQKNKIHSGWWERTTGYQQPWEHQLAYNARYLEASFTYLNPRAWLPIEMGRIRRAINSSPTRRTIVYAVSASGMACKFGLDGMNQTLDAANQLCLQLLHERQGAIQITLMADHGHNLIESHSASKSLKNALTRAGYKTTTSIHSDQDVVIELAALVNYVGVRTKRSPDVARALITAPEVEFAIYQQDNSIIIQSADGSAAIDYENGNYRYRILTHDVLHYGKLSGQFASAQSWFTATQDAQYPDAPERLWEAFHGLVLNPPEVMLTLKPGFFAGKETLQHFIQMKSTHGSLDQQNTATFLMTMRRNLPDAVRSDDILNLVEPASSDTMPKL